LTDPINDFYTSIVDVINFTGAQLIPFFIYFLTENCNQPAAITSQIKQCFNDCDLTLPHVAQRLSDGQRKKPQKFIKGGEGYRLERLYKVKIANQLGGQRLVAETSVALRNLEGKLADGVAKGFLQETKNCFEGGAHRATITMTWILALDHLYKYILAHDLEKFNAVLASCKNSRVKKVFKIEKRDDSPEKPDDIFILLCREAGIIPTNVREILDSKRNTRNASAHPSGAVVTEIKAIDFVTGLVNVVLKYPI
jgi:hypothetical protein